MKKTGICILLAALLISGFNCHMVQGSAKVSLSQKNITLNKGSKKKLQVKNAKKKVTWSIKTGKKYISLVSKKKYSVTVIAKKKGNARVCAKVDGKVLFCRVTVKEKKKKTDVTGTPAPVPTQTVSPEKTPVVSPTLSPSPVPTATPTVAPTDILDLAFDFTDASIHDFKGRGSAGVEITTDPVEQKNALFVTNRSGNWNGVEYDLTEKLKTGTNYYFSAEVMHTNASSLTMDMSVDTGDGYPGISQKTVPANTWVTLSGEFYVTDENRIVWYVQVMNHATADFYIRNVKIQEGKEDEDVVASVLAYDSLAESAQKYGFSLGTVIDRDTVREKTFQAIAKKHFNSLSAGNAMKAYALCDREASQKSSDGMPRMNFYYADQIMRFASDNGLKVRGHCLVWDFKMTELVNWFFREGYTDDGAYVSTDVAKKRLESYIKQVVEHFDTKYPGVVYCWDVVNEAVGDEGCYEEGDPSRIRTHRWLDGEKTENVFYKMFGRDYVKLAFQYARKYCSKETKLYYNDYSCENENKCDAIIRLVNELNAEEKLVDGIGSQSYLWEGNDWMLQGVRTSLLRLSRECNVDVQVTELTMGNDDKDDSEHALWYYKLFELYKELVQKENVALTNITIWGINDGEEGGEFLTLGPYHGILTKDFHAKKSLEAVSCSLKGIPYPIK